MRIAADNRLSKNIIFILCFIGFLLYAGILNRYHLSYLEQTQLFQYDRGYLAGFFLKPGGLIQLLGSFITQFFYYPWLGSLILALVVILICQLTHFILKTSGLNGILFSVLPVICLAALHSSHNYLVSCTLGWLASLSVFAVFIRLPDPRIRFRTGIVFFVLLYFLAGLFSFLTLILCMIHEIFHTKGYRKYIFLLTAICLAVVIPFLSWKYIYLLPFEQAWLSPARFPLVKPVHVLFFITALYFPLAVLFTYISQRLLNNTSLYFPWNLKNLLSGISVFVLTFFLVIRWAYDRNNELFLNIDAGIQASSWNRVLTLSRKYPGQNQLIMYYTNLALYKTGNLANSMFHYRQSGTKGLWLEWERNETAPFFGGEVYYHLGYINEAFRWAFEAMEAKGPNPRSLKRLVITSIINRDYQLARKYLSLLDQTMFYRRWSRIYHPFIADTNLIPGNEELQEKRKFLLHDDFIAYNNDISIGLERLLESHPDNRMAFEYLMASCLLRKDLDAFSANIYRLKDFRYAKIPQHYEEALVLYTGLSGKDAVPDGYEISKATRERFHQYAQVFAANRYDMNQAARALYRSFGGTFWFYMQFTGPGAVSSGLK
jgi:hypothetical protein